MAAPARTQRADARKKNPCLACMFVRSLVVALLIGVAATGCLDSGDRPPTDTPTVRAPGVIHFIAMGDFGDGKEDQFRVAQAIGQVCAEIGCDFVLGLGDNIYPSGVTSAYDPQFESKFEVPYADLDMPFYMTLGNHDDGEPTRTDLSRGAHQIQYSYRMDRTSDKWVMPDRNYTFTVGDAQFWALDTHILLHHRDLEDNAFVFQSGWLNETLGASNSTWRIAFGHHPYISNSRYGNAGTYELSEAPGRAVARLVEDHLCGQVDVFFAGHAHNMQWLEPVEACGDTHFIVSGGGGKQPIRAIVDQGNPAFFQNGEVHGFFWGRLDGERLDGRFYDKHGGLLFEHSIFKS